MAPSCQADGKSEVCSTHTHAKAGNASYIERTRRISVAVSKSNVERNRSRKFTPRTPVNSQPGRKVYYEDFKHLDNDPFNLQSLETKA